MTLLRPDLTQFFSGFNYQKIATKGNSTHTATVGSTTVTIPHNLGYIPSVRVWYDPDNGQRFPLSNEQYTDDTTSVSEVNLVSARAHLTTTDLVIEYTNSDAGSHDVTTYWRVYYDT